jgi:Ca-activated chloride channel homolog
VLVLDASGSMSILDASGSTSDKLGSVTRMKVAKNAVQQLIERWDLQVPLGLTAYGHRNNGCQDIEILVPVGPVDRARFLGAVGELQPKGSSPLTAAMIAAAEQLDYTAHQATVILVSDGAESCRLDPCAVAESLEAKGVDLTVHVVGFGVSAEVRESKLSCIAKNTGGQYRTASDAESLASALTALVSDVSKPAGSDKQHAIRPQAALEARLSRARAPRPRKTPRARCSGP